MVALTLITIYCICFIYGFAATELKLRSQRVQQYTLSHQPNMNTYDERKPLIYANMLGVVIVAGAFFTAFDFMFSLSRDFTWGSLIAQALFIMLIDDAWFYMYHRTLHLNKTLFRKIHSIHHRVRSTMPLDYIYAHPLEWMMGAVGVFIACAILYFLLGAVNAYALFLYGFIRTIHEINIHSGLKSWISPHRVLAWIGSSEDHAMHHSKFKGNYASAFKWWDAICKTSLRDNTPS